MALKSILKKVCRSLGYEVYNLSRPGLYSQDCLTTFHNHDFMHEPRFVAAYQRGIKASGVDHHIHWRVHVALWVASQVRHLPGAFVECGVSRGFLSSAIMQFLVWNSLQKDFYLIDTFRGLDERFLTPNEKNKTCRLSWYKDLSFESVQENFSEFKNVHLIQGVVPECLGTVEIPNVCYLCLDMNCTVPEIEAASFFWEKLVPGGMILLDDYAYAGYEDQNRAFRLFAARKRTDILTLPTGQGLILKR
jgi:Macrocin-O-methyltransferase (TylF)